MNKREAEKIIRELADAVIVKHEVPSQEAMDGLEAAGYKLERLKLTHNDGIRVTYPDGSMGFATRVHTQKGKNDECTVYTMEDMHRFETCTRMLVDAERQSQVYDIDKYADGIERDGLRNQVKQACEQLRKMLPTMPAPEPEPMPAHERPAEIEPAPELEPATMPAPGQDDLVPLECYEACGQPAHETIGELHQAPAPEPAHEPRRAHESVMEWLARPHMGIAVTRKNERSCWWVTGDTKPRRDQLKEMGFRWSPKKRAWYLRPQAV